VKPFNRLKRACVKASSENPAAKIFRKFSVRFLALACCCWLIVANAQAAPGDLDPTFGNGGVNNAPTGMNLLYAAGMALQPDGKILVGGACYVGNVLSNRRFCVIRYLPNGALDTSFGTNGLAYGSFVNYELFLTDIALLPNGKIVAIGSYSRSLGFPSIYAVDSIIAIFSPQGVQETLFIAHHGSGLFAGVNAIAVQPDGKFVVVGDTGAGYKIQVPFKQIVLRFTENGAYDTSFGTDGVVINTEWGVSDSVAVQPDGKILTAGGNAIIRYFPNGSVDVNFGNRGMAIAPTPAYNNGEISLAVQPDGKIVGAASVNSDPNYDFAVFRLNPDGSPDFGFGMNGLVVTPISNQNDMVRDLVLQPDGKILVIGQSKPYTMSDVAIVRHNPNGSLDPGFGTGGIVRAPSNGYYPSDAVLQPDGKILVMSIFSVIRYLNDATAALRAANFDFDGDGQADFAVTRHIDANQNWYAVKNPSFALLVETEWGLTTDKIVPADYDGDRKTDLAVFRPSDGNWYILKSASGAISTVQFGQNGDVPAPSDFDGDGRADTAVFRAGNWYILNSSNGGFRAEQFGIAGDKPLPSDFDGDGRADVAVYRGGTWYAQGSTTGFFAADFGLADDIPVPADYDGDGKTDLAVYRDGNWYLQNSIEGFKAFQFGQPGDKPVPADYDADGKTNIAVFRSGVWYILGAAGDLRIAYFGYADDRPVATAFQP
jgi:uncharacterized delta-60 repeat protein